MDLNPEAFRPDFPLLTRPGAPIYLDNACMTLKPRSVIDAVVSYYEDTPYCGGRAVYEGSHSVERLVETARAKLAGFLGGDARATVFTKNATEAINLVAHSHAWKAGDVVLTTDREHNSNLVPWQQLAARGVRHEVVPSRDDGTLDLDAWRARLAVGDVALVAAVHVSNLDGYETPAGELVRLAHDAGARVLLDGAQAAAHAPVDLAAIGADYYAVSIHKMLGPTGVGALLAKRDALDALAPFITGGDTVARTTYANAAEFLDAPAKFEAGLQNYAGLAGTAPAIDYLARAGMQRIHAHERALARRVHDALLDVDGVTPVGAPIETRSGIVPIALGGDATGGHARAQLLDAHAIAILLEDKHNILVRSGDHCLHSWFNARGVPGAVRASFALYTTQAEADAFVDAVKALVRALTG